MSTFWRPQLTRFTAMKYWINCCKMPMPMRLAIMCSRMIQSTISKLLLPKAIWPPIISEMEKLVMQANSSKWVIIWIWFERLQVKHILIWFQILMQVVFMMVGVGLLISLFSASNGSIIRLVEHVNVFIQTLI